MCQVWAHFCGLHVDLHMTDAAFDTVFVFRPRSDTISKKIFFHSTESHRMQINAGSCLVTPSSCRCSLFPLGSQNANYKPSSMIISPSHSIRRISWDSFSPQRQISSHFNIVTPAVAPSHRSPIWAIYKKVNPIWALRPAVWRQR